ncbi:type II toxin-antitoxin system RelE/ParE family toxin [Stieleria sp. TO1_6]|uniref:type II toxin-antitoxin system RelE/ParE family toxin n=1 Tax=Stieleria tagensis TaxID=2956795 RepID=UPI00209AEC67|nr:type II toxin-antitoxin system RelE/ParE family toxin [Stieleria tagensis]MCO8120492.1 type II toxin-antitoxin system RelE/ParE family toxin [Stieleria tagensis]
MTGRKVPYRRQLAIEDIAGHSDRIAETNLDAAFRFLDAIEETVELLCQFPEAGGAVPTIRQEAEGLRAKLVNDFRSYVVLYFVTAETIDVARVIRGGQELDQIALQCN